MPAQYTRSRYLHFGYEIRYTPWFGPLARAKTALEKVDVPSCAEIEFLDFIREMYSRPFSNLTHVQFYIFPAVGKRKMANQTEYHIAVIYLGPDPESRQVLYDRRVEITQTTGWYPLVMGTRATPIISRDKLKRHATLGYDQLRQIQTGKLRLLRSVAEYENSSSAGNAFVVEGETGSILFDTGFRINRRLPSNLNAVVLTHFHADHAGGIEDVLPLEVPVLLTEPTLRQLYDRFKKDPKRRRDLLQNALVIERLENTINRHYSLAVFPVFHVPGSIGCAVRDDSGATVIYPGDLCLKNGFLDYSRQTLQTILELRTDNTWVFVDAAMVSKEDDAIEEDDTPQNLLEGIFSDLHRRDVVFTSKSPETLVYEYILAFLASRTLSINSVPVKLVVSPALQRLCETIFGPMIFRKYTLMDPFLKSVVGTNATNFIESHRLYPLDSLRLIPPEEHVIVFAAPGDLDHHKELQKRIRGSHVILAGTVAIRDDELPTILISEKPRSILRVSSPDWNFHSNEVDLATFVWALTKEEIHVVLFHASWYKMESFIQKYPTIDGRYIHFINDKGIRFN